MYVRKGIYVSSLNNMINKRAFVHRLNDEFEPDSKVFSFELQDGYLLEHSNDIIYFTSDLQNFVQGAQEEQAGHIYTNVNRIEELTYQIDELNVRIENFEQIDSAFAPRVEELVKDVDALEEKRIAIMDENDILQQNIEVLDEIEIIASDVLNDLIIESGILGLSAGSLLVLVKLIKVAPKAKNEILKFIEKIVNPFLKAKDRTKSNILDILDFYSGSNKDVLIVFAALSLTLSFFMRSIRGGLLKLLGDSNFESEFIKLLKKNIEARREYDRVRSENLKNAVENSLEDFNSIEGFEEFNINSFNLDQQIPTYQKYRAFQDIIFANKKTTVIRGKTEENIKFEQKTIIYPKLDIKLNRRVVWKALLKFILKK